MGSVIIGHAIRGRRDAFFNLLDNFNIELTLWIAYLLAFLTVMSLFILLNEITDRIRFGGKRTAKFSKRITLALTKFRIKISKQRAIGIFVMFVYIFIWLTQLFLTNNIKVNV